MRYARYLAFALVAVGHVADSRPNVVLIMTDDQGYGDLGISGNPVLEGKWLLRGDRAASYTLELRWLKPVPAGSVEVKAGSETRTLDVPVATARVVANQLSLPSGDFDFSATHHSAAGQKSAYHATLTR